jgi:hypothetical protein
MVRHKAPSQLLTRQTHDARYLSRKDRQKLFIPKVRSVCLRWRKFDLSRSDTAQVFLLTSLTNSQGVSLAGFVIPL